MSRRMKLPVLAIGVVAAIALPASTSANWKHHKTPIQKDVQLSLVGVVSVEGKLGTVRCDITSEVKLLAGTTTGQWETFEPDEGTETEKCTGVGGLAACQFHNLNPQVPNWQFHIAPWQTTVLINHANGQQTTVAGSQHTTAVTVTTQAIEIQPTGGFCPIKHVNITGGTMGLTCTPSNCETVTGLHVNYLPQAHISTGATQHKEEVEVNGLFAIEFDYDTYSI